MKEKLSTIQVKQPFWKKAKIIGAIEGLTVREVIHKAIEDLSNKYNQELFSEDQKLKESN